MDWTSLQKPSACTGMRTVKTQPRPKSGKKNRVHPGKKNVRKKGIFSDPVFIEASKHIWLDPDYDFTKPTLPTSW
ncbi:MAG: hypothetical protein LBK99_23300 [Opitutaceae bacterium]|jgi:hypothetical protein|nr:hypothetical protein [Opitutaceae bacterium]